MLGELCRQYNAWTHGDAWGCEQRGRWRMSLTALLTPPTCPGEVVLIPMPADAPADSSSSSSSSSSSTSSFTSTSTFTQQDVNDGAVWYRHFGDGTQRDAFHFQVSVRSDGHVTTREGCLINTRAALGVFLRRWVVKKSWQNDTYEYEYRYTNVLPSSDEIKTTQTP